MPHEVSTGRYEFRGLRLDEEDKSAPDFKDSDTLAIQLRATGETKKVLSNFSKLNHFDKLYWDTLLDKRSLVPSDADFTQIPPRRTGSVVHNYQHDLESLWWRFLWFVTLRVGYEPSVDLAWDIFRGHSGPGSNAVRSYVFEWGCKNGRRQCQDKWYFHPDLQSPFSDLMTTLRRGMVTDTFLRPIMGQLMIPSSYSTIHALFAKQFDELNNKKERPWAKMRVR